MRLSVAPSKIFSILAISVAAFLPILAQDPPAKFPKSEPQKASSQSFDEVWKNYPDRVDLRNADFSDHFSMKWLRRDLRIADVVAHVKVFKKELVDHTEGADCESDRGTGYCSYRLTADVIRIYKGRIDGGTLEFFGSSDADYPKAGFMGERVIFLKLGEAKRGSPPVLGTMENSTRWIDQNVLAKMRVVIDSRAAVDEGDEREPYSKVSIEESLRESDAVAYIKAVKFRPDPDSMIGAGAIVTATVKEVFKGNLRIGETIEYRDDLLHRSFRNEDLGEQVVYLQNYTPRAFDTMELDKASGKTVRRKGEIKEKDVRYRNLEYTEGFIKHGILEKLRIIAKGNI